MSALPVTATRAEIVRAHRLKMRNKKTRRAYGYETELMRHVSRFKAQGVLRFVLGNFSRADKDRTQPRLSIWPEHKFAKPGRMA